MVYTVQGVNRVQKKSENQLLGMGERETEKAGREADRTTG